MNLSASLPLRTDLYELTMMQGYWAAGRSEEWGSFELTFRDIPEGGGYCIAAGIEDALALIEQMHFSNDHLDYLRSLQLFQPAFLENLSTIRFRGDVRAVAEGSLIFPHEPLIEVSGPLPEAQWIESMLLNTVNFQTLIATKARRIVEAAKPAAVIEYGLRRAHGPNGALWASRASYLAGAVGTSNVEAGYIYGLPLYGTHAHSWVQSFDDEATAFRTYSDVFPNNSVLLIDTYDTLGSGLPLAIAEAKRLEQQGGRLVGIRLDSGDLAYLAKECRRRLDEAGLAYVKIVASSDIDEYLLQDLKVQGAPIDLYGVGTKLVTAFQDPALGGVYKLVAIQRQGSWLPKIKISSNPIKTTIPGRKQIYRWESQGKFLGDCLATIDDLPPNHMRHADIEYKQTSLSTAELTPLLEQRMKDGQVVLAPRTLDESRKRVDQEMAKLPAEHHRLANPHAYRVGLSDRLFELRRQMIDSVRHD